MASRSANACWLRLRLLGLGTVLQQPLERFGQVADLQGWHGLHPQL
jgi:hypothetical protein